MSNVFTLESLEPRLQFSGTNLLPDLVPVASKSNAYMYGWSIDTSRPGHRLLRLNSAISNQGSGPLELFGGAFRNGKQQVFQRIFRSNGTSFTRHVGTFSAKDDNEVYFDNFAQFSLAIRTKNNGVGKIVRHSGKKTCCLSDDVQVKPSLPGSPGSSVYQSCTAAKQGISVGWADIYDKFLAGQFIDVTGLKPGRYWLHGRGNPHLNIMESSTKNDMKRIPILLK
jgi:hypothetical protein